MSVLGNILGYFLQNKFATALSVALLAFLISTILLAVRNNEVKSGLRGCQDEYEESKIKSISQEAASKPKAYTDDANRYVYEEMSRHDYK
ncbi:hypothetical protein Bhyg_11370 [Pseudolycoriella hygida]|uniref:Uncharacterized protein n=1 Tax=Pseudolycoriella hygida TaxID=35572 RepID=A0A9Q0MVA7_9DIPT|nr:hypothetical protein Bhyg_11370 [Pseudolycoriella hygida]